MKKNALLMMCALCLTLSVFAQEEADSSKITIDGSPYNFIFSWQVGLKKAYKSHWTGFGFAFSNLSGLNDVDLNLSKSYSVVLNIADYIIPFNHNWLMSTGLGFDWSRYHFKGNHGLQEVDGKTVFAPDPEAHDYRDSKLLVYYATIPVLLEYQTKINGHHTLFIYGGVEGLVKLYSKSQVEVQMPHNHTDKIAYRNLNLLPLNYRLTARIGIEDFSIFGYYQPLSMFEKDKGPDLCSRGIGLMMNF